MPGKGIEKTIILCMKSRRSYNAIYILLCLFAPNFTCKSEIALKNDKRTSPSIKIHTIEMIMNGIIFRN